MSNLYCISNKKAFEKPWNYLLPAIIFRLNLEWIRSLPLWLAGPYVSLCMPVSPSISVLFFLMNELMFHVFLWNYIVLFYFWASSLINLHILILISLVDIFVFYFIAALHSVKYTKMFEHNKVDKKFPDYLGSVRVELAEVCWRFVIFRVGNL